MKASSFELNVKPAKCDNLSLVSVFRLSRSLLVFSDESGRRDEIVRAIADDSRHSWALSHLIFPASCQLPPAGVLDQERETF